MIEWSLNPKKPVLTRKSAASQDQVEPLVDSKHANKKPIEPALSTDKKEENKVGVAVDQFSDEDDLDALEALAAAESDIPPPVAEKSLEAEDKLEPKGDSN